MPSASASQRRARSWRRARQVVGRGGGRRPPAERLEQRPVPLGDLVGLGPGRRVRRDLLQRRAQGLGVRRARPRRGRRAGPGPASAARSGVELAQRGGAVLAQRRGRVRVARQRRQRVGEDARGVEGAGAAAAAVRRRLRELAQPGGQRHQRAGQVAAVHGRDVARGERRQADRVVPVEQVALVALERLDGGERVLDPVRELAGAAGSPGRARRASRAAPCRCWSARCGGRCAAPGPPARCRAAASGPAR